MLVIVSVSRLDNDRIEIRVARPQHDSTRTLTPVKPWLARQWGR